MTEIPEDLQQWRLDRGKELVNLISEGSKKNQSIRTGQEMDSLLSLAAKQRSDAVEFTHFSQRKRFTDDLDKIINDHIAKNPEMEGKAYVAIILDEALSTEVVEIESVVDSVVDVGREEAEKLMKEHPLGYFQRADFNAKTPETLEYQELKQKLDHFFDKNSDLIEYLRGTSSGNAASIEELYKPPTGF